jgi:amino acid adenylation domain-containing protein
MRATPLSRAQRGLWFLHRLRPESSAYNLAAAARVHGELSSAEIRAFFQAMVDRHAVLRATFPREGGEPVQIIHERSEVAFEEIDAGTWTEATLRAALDEAAWRPFDLERGPVFRVALFHRGEERLLVVALHHIVADFASIALFQNPGSVPGEEKSYADFVAWQAALLTGPEGERLWSYWRERLAGLPELELPVDRTDRSDQGGACWREISSGTLIPLKALARAQRATLYVTLLAAFQALLHRYTGQEDFAVGSPASGRPRGFGRTFGSFMNPLVLRADLAGDPSFRELVDRTRRSVADALDHQHFPLSLLVERLRPGEELFRALLLLHQGPEGLVSLILGLEGRLPLAGFELESLPLGPRAAQVDVELMAGERRGRLSLKLVYDAVRFDATTAARWLQHLEHLLAGAAGQPDVPVSELPLLSPWERQQVLVEVNDGSAVDPPWGLLHEGFERQAEATPQAIALIDQERRLTYRELNERASELADRLRRKGVGPETVVGVRLPRTAELIVSLLGILKAGGAYLPLDPSYPEERIAFMVADAGARQILHFGKGSPGSTIQNPLAYLIYTSGSTGRPKGVAIEHDAAVRFVAWAGQAFSPEELRGVLAATSVSFDLSVFEIFVPLSFGGTVILAENVLALPSLPARDEVTLINTVPSALAGLLELGGLPASVRTVNVGGEALRRPLADRILATGVKLWDLYGPTEDTVYSTGAVIAAGDPLEPAIGWPVAGSQAYVVDRKLRPLPVGIPGELCLGGGGLARGYLGRPELTAERFVPDPFGGRPGARLYRTGDLARRRPDGTLEYLGRFDHQVKIRGFRIELGEVEAALLDLPWVREAVVVAREGTLAAYVSVQGARPDQPEAALREALGERLPAPFVPSFFVVLEALPRTSNGKVDRKALPAPALAEAGAFVPPAGVVEETLAAIWADLLGRTEIGRQDRFFDLGGHSLLAVRALARVRETWATEIPLSAFFEDPTLAGMARRIEAAGQAAIQQPIPRAPRDLPLPLSFAQRRFWLLDRLEPGEATYNVPVALRLRGPLDPAVLAGALREIVRRHEALRTTFVEGEDEPFQRIDPPPEVFLLPCVDLETLPPEHASSEEIRLILADAQRPFDLARGPFLRVLLVRRSPEEHRLVLVLHHIACDGWSLGLLLSDLSSLSAGRAIPEPPLQYADFAAWQRREPVPDHLLAAWRDRLAGAPELELPADRLEPSHRSSRGTTLMRLLPADLVTALTSMARRRGATLFMALLAGFDALLIHQTGQTDLIVGTVAAGRGRVELERVVGCFVNTLALRVRTAGLRSFEDLLAEVRSVTLAAFRDQDLPFERLVEELQLDRGAAGRPFPRALLILQNEPLAPPALPEIKVEAEPVDTGAARSDLTLSFHEVAGGLLATIELRRDLFDETTVARLWERFVDLLAAVAADPLLPLGEGIADLLRLPERGHRRKPSVFEPPFGPVEEKMAAIWSEVLGRERIGRWDNFFERGGHSLRAAQVVSRVRRAFGVEIPLRSLFEEPTLAGLAGRIAAAAGEEGLAPFAGMAGEGPAPLSFAQQRLWFLAQLEPASPVYNLPAAVRLQGILDAAALERVLAAVVRRQESLRTRFPWTGGEPVQVVDEATASPLSCVDLRALGPLAEPEACRLASREAARPFDLQSGPLFRALLLCLTGREHLLVITLHHIISDGWSLGVFVRELEALSAALPLPELPVRYRDFAVWQRARLRGEPLERGLAFWRDELRGLPPGIDLPTDRPRPPVQTFRGAVRPFSLDPATTGRLRELARAEGATLFMALLALFQALLARWAGQEDLAVGTPVAGRTRLELEGLIGFFVNTLVLRGDLTGDPDARTLVRRARERFLAAQAHQDLPFEKLVEELRPERDLARPPLAQVLLVLQNAPRAPLALPGLKVVPEPVETGAAKVEIQLTLEEAGGGLIGSLDFNRDLFDASTVDRFLGHLSTLLAAAVATPDGRILELEILTAHERQQILSEHNPSERFPREPPVHERFAAQAALRPQAVAVVCGDARLTYGELERQADALARHLRRLGVGPEERVALCLERSIGMIVGILGVLKAGGAYVPLDPEHPPERQALVLADAQPRVVLTQSDLAERLPFPAAREDGAPLGDAGVCEKSPQYILYTSGSTGLPKGVVIPHAAVARLFAGADSWFHFGPDDVWTLFSSLAFDFSVWEIWGALAFGGRLVLVPYWVSRTPSAFYELIADEGVTVLSQTPSAFRQLVQAEGDLPAPRGLALRRIVFGGEALDPAFLAPWFARHGDQKPQMINMYGITETTVHVTARRMTAADVPRAPRSLIGQPLPDLQLYLLDPRQLPIPVGVLGEICVGGDGLARGYLRRPDLTPERFIPDPFSGRPGARLYRSGDLARRLPDGDIESRGRIDFQVKIRGFRIELGEIEAVLAAFPAVRDAVVLAREDRSGERRLMAWLVPQGDLREDELRGFLRSRLPESMLPAAFVLLEALPMTANGKLDRRALPEPRVRSGETAVLPRTDTEEAIAAVWREALGLETIGVDDSFFDLGGHSLLAVQVHRRLVPRFPGLAVVDLFRYPTISALAGYLSGESVDQISLQEVRERAEDRTGRARRQRELRRQTRGR